MNYFRLRFACISSFLVLFRILQHYLLISAFLHKNIELCKNYFQKKSQALITERRSSTSQLLNYIEVVAWACSTCFKTYLILLKGWLCSESLHAIGLSLSFAQSTAEKINTIHVTEINSHYDHPSQRAYIFHVRSDLLYLNPDHPLPSSRLTNSVGRKGGRAEYFKVYAGLD